jgi:esterase
VGHSLGGRIALAASALAPGRVSDVTMLDISPMPIDPALSASRRVLDVVLQAPDRIADRRQMRAFLIERGLSPALSDWLLMNMRSEGDGYGWRIDRAAMDRLHERFTRADLSSLVHPGTVRVRCIRGGQSPYVSEADAARLMAAGVQVDTLPQAGHFVHVDALEPLLDLLAAEPA